MISLETKDIGLYGFDYFSIDVMSDSFLMGGEKYHLGQFTATVANLPFDYVNDLLKICLELNKICSDLHVNSEYSMDQFITAKIIILDVIRRIENVKPFCYFDVENSKKKIDESFSDERIKSFVSIDSEEDALHIKEAVDCIITYIYLVNDIANFRNVAIKFTESVMRGDSRRKEDLAKIAFKFFTDNDSLLQLYNYNPYLNMEGLRLRPWVMQVPTVVPAYEADFAIARRLYFTRFMDFLITELFEALSHGHYLWRCGVCGKYFLMTSARRQLYCSDVNENYGVPCSYAAGHPDVINKKLKKESKKNSPVYDLWQKRYNSIRKDKSLGKCNEAVYTEAKKIIDAKRDRARVDFDYAKNEYEKEMDLKLIYEEAVRNVDGRIQ